jgi:hypothetical protein
LVLDILGYGPYVQARMQRKPSQDIKVSWFEQLLCQEKESGSHHMMMTWRVVFGVVITDVFWSWAPINREVAFFDAVLDPI